MGIFIKGKFYKYGFTLAEVLITLAVIGVVAALTIPTVVHNYQKTQTVTRLKKTYSAISNTANLAIADHGPIDVWEIDESNSEGPKNFANTYMIPYLKVSKNCETKTTGDCEFKWNYLDKSASGVFGSGYTRFYLNDGTLIAVSIYQNTDTEKRMYITVDLNGQKMPNAYGRDIYSLSYFIKSSVSSNQPYIGKLIPNGISVDRATLVSEGKWDCNIKSTGFYCTALIMKDGWEMKDDYPW
jgi:prepilin-type N-terminal cleavage/methylation domain-containing protein